MADLIRGDVALALDHFGEIPTATVLRRGQRLARQGFAARNDIETPLGAAMAGYILGLSGRRMTDESGISLRAAMETPIRRHACAYRAIEANTENILEAARPAGSHFPECHHLGVAANPAWGASGDYERLAEGLDKAATLTKTRGLTAHYHPHLSTIVEGPAEVDRIFALTSINFCPDTAHLAAAGGDVPAMIRKHRARISYVHLKGLRKEPFAFTPLDEGDLDNAAVIKSLADTNYSGWITAELDAWPDPKDGAVRSLAFMKRTIAGA